MQGAIKIAINLVAAYASVYWASALFGLKFDENERQYWPGRPAADHAGGSVCAGGGRLAIAGVRITPG